MKRKRLGRYDWSRVLERKDSHCCWEKNGQKGEAALIQIEKVSAPAVGTFRGEPVVIADDGYSWLQIAVEGQHWWLTAMLAPNGALTQYYFDITLENHLLGSRDSWFWDLYLDVVLMPDGRLDLLDEDELDEALASGDITAEQHALAHDCAGKLMKELPERLPQLQEFCRELEKELRRNV